MESIRTALGRLVLGMMLLAAPALAQISIIPVPPAAVGVSQINGPDQGNNGQ